MAFSKPFGKDSDECKSDEGANDITKIKDPWYHIEGLKKKDRFKIYFYKRFGQLIYKITQ
jgi:hypothetical protein